ncbi:MAG: 1-deoxy-D-xylulose-5-phosphate reductoisomerase, partial [Brevinema sp.]
MENICLLGATGSVGASVLAVIRRYPERFVLHSFSAWKNMEKAVHIIEEFHPKYVLLQENTNDNLPVMFPQTQFLYGEEGLVDLAMIDDHDTVVNAVNGTAGFLPSLGALKQGKKLLIANKEALVSGGKFLIEAERKNGGR